MDDLQLWSFCFRVQKYYIFYTRASVSVCAIPIKYGYVNKSTFHIAD